MPDQVKTTSKKIMIGSEDKSRPSSLHFRCIFNSQRMISTICTTFQFKASLLCFRMLHLSSVLASKSLKQFTRRNTFDKEEDIQLNVQLFIYVLNM